MTIETNCLKVLEYDYNSSNDERERESKKTRNNNAKHESLSMLSNRIRNEKWEKKMFKLIFIFCGLLVLHRFTKPVRCGPRKS